MSKLIAGVAIASLTVALSGAAAAETQRSFVCKEPLPQFALGEKSNPSQEQLDKLCACIWEKFPVNGWERRTSATIRAGEDPGSRLRAFIYRFGHALKNCGANKL